MVLVIELSWNGADWTVHLVIMPPRSSSWFVVCVDGSCWTIAVSVGWSNAFKFKQRLKSRCWEAPRWGPGGVHLLGIFRPQKAQNQCEILSWTLTLSCLMRDKHLCLSSWWYGCPGLYLTGVRGFDPARGSWPPRKFCRTSLGGRL